MHPSYYWYVDPFTDEKIYPTDKAWSFSNYMESEDKGPSLQATRDYVILLQDPYEEVSEGGIYYGMNTSGEIASMEPTHPGTVLSVGSDVVEVTPGDRVTTIKWVQFNVVPDPYNERLRRCKESELFGFID